MKQSAACEKKEASVYRRYWDIFRNISYRLNLFRICSYEEHDGDRILILCNIWKLVHPARGHFRVYMREPGSLRWKMLRYDGFLPDNGPIGGADLFRNLRPRRRLPEIPLWPLDRIGDSDWRIKKIVLTVFLWCAAATRARISVPWETEKSVLNALYKYLFGRPLFHAEIRENSYRDICSYVCGNPPLIISGKMAAGLVMFRRTFWRQFRDAAVMSAFRGVMGYRKIRLEQYAFAASYAPGLLRVASERKNCLPLLPFVHPLDWGRQDLFGRNMRGDLHGEAVVFQCIRDAAWRSWFFRQPQTLIRAVMGRIRGIPWTRRRVERELSVIATLRDAGVSRPVGMLAYFARHIYLPGLSESRSHALCRAFCAGTRRIMQQSGTKRFKPAFYGQNGWNYDGRPGGDIVCIQDCIRNHPGILDRPHILWQGLQALSEAWHEDYDLVDNPADLRSDDRSLSWGTPYAVEFRERLFRELVTTDDLLNESRLMRHCAYTYADECMGGYRIFHFTGEDGNPYTLGIGKNGRMHQCFGVRNVLPPEKETRTAAAFCKYLKGLLNSTLFIK